jgi:hypothetical protein
MNFRFGGAGDQLCPAAVETFTLFAVASRVVSLHFSNPT